MDDDDTIPLRSYGNGSVVAPAKEKPLCIQVEMDNILEPGHPVT